MKYIVTLIFMYFIAYNYYKKEIKKYKEEHKNGNKYTNNRQV